MVLGQGHGAAWLAETRPRTLSCLRRTLSSPCSSQIWLPPIEAARCGGRTTSRAMSPCVHGLGHEQEGQWTLVTEAGALRSVSPLA